MIELRPPPGDPVIRITIPQIPVSPNGPSGLLRMGGRARTRYNWWWLTWVRVSIEFPQTCLPISSIVSIHQIRVQLLDPDNLVASCKPVLDALAHWGLIFGDDPDHLELFVTQEKGKPVSTEIKIWRLSAS